jgi:hypothetical protein
MTNQDSFVAFYPTSKGKAHYQCMKEHDDKIHQKSEKN